jgi:hypothetical protein
MRDVLPMKIVVFSGLLCCASPIYATTTRSLKARIEKCEQERKELRAEILSSPYFIEVTKDKSGDQIEALIYSVGNSLSNNISLTENGENSLQGEGRRLASSNQLSDSDIETFRSYIKNRNLLNSLYLQLNQALSQ